MFRGTAHVYDLIYEAAGKDYAAESAVLVELIRARQPAARTLLDVACGTGAHLVHLQRELHLVATHDGVDHIVDRHEMTLFEPAEYEAAFRAAGLEAERVPSPISDRDRYLAVAPS